MKYMRDRQNVANFLSPVFFLPSLKRIRIESVFRPLLQHFTEGAYGDE